MAQQTLTRAQRKLLEDLMAEHPLSLDAAVATDILAQDDPIDWLQGLLQNGCVSGWVNDLIYYVDTHAFYDKHYDEIEDLRVDYEDSIGEPLRIKSDLKNWLAWFAYEQTAQRIADKLGIDI